MAKKQFLFESGGGLQWSGFGPMPGWLREELAGETSLTVFLNPDHPNYERKKALLLKQEKTKMATAAEMKAHVKAIDESVASTVKPKPLHRRRRVSRSKTATPTATQSEPKRKYTKRNKAFWTAQEREHMQKLQQATLKVKVTPTSVAEPTVNDPSEWFEFSIDDQVYVPATHRYGVIKSALQTSLVDPTKRVHMVNLIDDEGDNVRVEVEPSLLMLAANVEIKLPQNVENLLLEIVTLTQKTEHLGQNYRKLKTVLSRSQYEARSKELEDTFLLLRRTLHVMLQN